MNYKVVLSGETEKYRSTSLEAAEHILGCE